MNKNLLIWLTGIGGILCAVLIGISDMLLLGTSDSGMAVYNQAYWPFMADRTPSALFWGANGSYTIILLFVGYVHWYMGVHRSAQHWMIGALATILFGLGCGAIGHYLIAVLSATYNEIVSSADVAIATPIVEMLELNFLAPVGGMALFGFAVGSVIFFVLTIRGKTVFPRWYAFFVPIILWPVSLLITSQLPAPVGGFASVTFHWPTVMAFAISTVILLRHPQETV